MLIIIFDSSQDLARLGVEAGCGNQSLYMEEGISAKRLVLYHLIFLVFSFVSFFLSFIG